MIRLDNLTKIFETAEGPMVAVDHISMAVPQGAICVLLGPSGCGKTTTLKMINRLIAPTSGQVYIDGTATTAYDPVELRRRIGYVIQQVGLFPNMTVEENICVVPKLLGWEATKAKTRAAELLEMLALDPAMLLKRYPKELSGGQQQRIGVARALAADPPVLLMDEPFGAVDPINRAIIQDEFLKMQALLRKTVLFVSHDIDEAVKMGDRIAIFQAGKLVQYDSPDHILAHPANDFIADFVGSDRTLKRLRLLTVGDAMDANAPRVVGDDSLEQAAGLMDKYGHESIVMVDAQGHARGVVRRAEMHHGCGTVGEQHESLRATINVTEDLRAAVSLMLTHDLSWLPCVDDNGVYKGYLTQQGIAHLLGTT
jgi:osmoprotectant transport system ATP-binding protein